MICTFGDITDVTWWRELSLPVRAVLQPDGRFRPITWGTGGWESTDAAPRAGRRTTSSPDCRPSKARAKIVELLGGAGDLLG